MSAQSVRAQIDITPWAPPQPIFNLCCAAYPTPVVDPWGGVHLFWADVEGYIWYARLVDGSWTQLVEVIVNPGRNVAVGLDAAVDGAGLLHLLWRDGNTGGAVYYANAPALSAGDARRWRPPIELASKALGAALAVAPNDSLYVVYTPFEAGVSFALISSQDGIQWSTPIFASGQLGSDFTGGSHMALTIDQKGDIHVAWNAQRYPTGYPEHAVYYQRSADGGQSWSAPYDPDPLPPEIEADRESNFKNKMPNVAIDLFQDVHLTWHEYTGQRMHRVSRDGGVTWSEMEPIFPNLGAAYNGPVDMAFDGDGNMHVVAARDGIWYRMRISTGQWTQPELVDARLADWHHQRVAVVGGNQVYLFYPDINATGVLWSTHRSVPAAAIEPLPPPTLHLATAPSFMPLSNSAPTATAPIPLPTNTPVPVSWREAPNTPTVMQTWTWVLLPLVVVVSAVIMAVVRRRA